MKIYLAARSRRLQKKISTIESSVQRLNGSVDQLRFEMRTSHMIDAQVHKSNAQWQDKAAPKIDSQNKSTNKGLGQGRSTKHQSVSFKTYTRDRVSEEPGLTEPIADKPSGAPHGVRLNT